MSIPNKPVVAGVADLLIPPGQKSDMLQIYVDVCKAAMEDAGVRRQDIDGLVMTSSAVLQWPSPGVYATMLADYLGIKPSYARTLPWGGVSSAPIVHLAASAIAIGMAKTILVASAEDITCRVGRRGVFERYAQVFHPSHGMPYGPTVITGYALAATRYMHLYGATPEQLAKVVVTMHKHGSLHPKALDPKLVTVEEVLSSRMVSSPMHLMECARVDDGGAALVMTTAERARDLKKRPAYLLGAGEMTTGHYIDQQPDVLTPSCKYSGEVAYRVAGVGPKDIDIAFLYDCFSIHPILELEALGFCKRGEAASFVEAGNIELGGKLPVNPHGGQFSYGATGMPNVLMSIGELVTQFRGEAGKRQVPGAHLGLVDAPAGIQSNYVTYIFGREG